jgi:PAS domain S-box-containing protein
MVRRVLSEAGQDDLLEPAQLLVSEVVTNALVHSGTSIDVSMSADEQGVLVEVGDGSKHIPRPRHYAATSITGRGLALLDQTADDWGVVQGIRGKTVWFVLSADSAHAGRGEPHLSSNGVSGAPEGEGETASPEDVPVTVELLNVPLLLHAAWQQHAEALLREHLLANIDIDTGGGPFVEHAMAVDALALLAEHIPAADVAVNLDQLMAEVGDPRMSMARLELTIPRHSVEHFDVLDGLMNEAQDMAQSGQLLAPVVQPELRMMRQWLCHQVVGQTAGHSPVAWPPSAVMAPPAKHALSWDAASVTGSAVPTVAADDTDLIVAVNADALHLLGYERAEDLLGQRLITIIPSRYRQAHLAGFTLHLLTGRGPLLAREVNVPVLCRDGSERTIRLGIEARRVTSGRTVFVATMRDVDEPAAAGR